MRGSIGGGGGPGPLSLEFAKIKNCNTYRFKGKWVLISWKGSTPSLSNGKKNSGFAPDLEIKFQYIAFNLIRSKNTHSSIICLIIHMGQVRYDISLTFCENLFQEISRTWNPSK